MRRSDASGRTMDETGAADRGVPAQGYPRVPKGKTPPQDLRRTIAAILWRHQNGAKWRAVPADLGPWSRAAQTFIRWARLGVWERLVLLAQDRGVQLGMTFLDGTSIRAHQKAAGAARKGGLKLSGTSVKRWGARGAGMGPKPA